MNRVKPTVNFPLSKSSELKVRAQYKKDRTNNVPMNADEKTLLNHFKDNGVMTRKIAYNVMADLYNQNVEKENAKLIETRKEVNKVKAKAKREYVKRKQSDKELKQRVKALKAQQKKYTFIIHLTIKKTFIKGGYELEGKQMRVPDEVVIVNETTAPITDYKRNIQRHIDEYEFSDAYVVRVVVNSRVEMMRGAGLNNNTANNRQLMRRGYILRNDWLKYSHGIAKTAYDETDDKCVYHQLTEYLLNPPSGNPSKFLNKRRITEDSLFLFFQEEIYRKNWEVAYPDFSKESGVSSELIELLCINLKRNMIGYDESQKVFHFNNESVSHHYSPIIFYKLHEHLYLIDDPSVIKSVVASNSTQGNQIISTTLEDGKKQVQSEVFLLEKWDVSKSKEMEEGIYIINQSNLDAELIEFLITFKQDPMTRTEKSNIKRIQFQVGLINKKTDKKYVIICIDVCFGERYTYAQLKNVAESSGIKYVNEGLGSLIVSILNKSSKSCRDSLCPTHRTALIERYGNVCNECKMPCESFEIDHIIPLASGGVNDSSNLQPLCSSCHKMKTSDENISGAYKVRDIETSVFNEFVVENIIKWNEWKSWAFIETVNNENELNEILNVYKIDTCKCRRNITYYSKYEFPVYTVMDIPRPFTGVLQCGMFYIETQNIFPFRGCGWYSLPIVEYGLSLNLININDIVMEFIPSNKLPYNHFQNSFDILQNAFKVEPALKKFPPNTLIGLFGRTISHSSKTLFTLSPHVAGKWLGEKDPKNEVFIKTITLPNREKLYEGIFSETVEQEGLKYCLYKQILEMEAVNLHQLETLIINEGGVILDRNTDAIRYARETYVNIEECYWDEEKTVLKYQTEEARPLIKEMMPRICRENELDYKVFELYWNTKEDYEGTVEDEALRLINTNQSIHIDGRAGCGKTYLIKAIITELNDRKIKHMGFSPTNKGARLIYGKTIHSIFYKFNNNKKGLLKLLDNVEYIFIDEVSMMIQDFYKLFILLKRLFPFIKFIIAGDYGQLPPVNDNWVGDYENSPAMHSLCDGNKLQLTKCRRADTELFELCRNINNIDITKFKPTEPTYLNLAYTHDTRIRINNLCNNRYLKEYGKDGVFIAEDKKNPKTQDVRLLSGMPVICHTTDNNQNILNSQTFKIINVNSETFTILNDNEPMKFKLSEFHKFFYLGFCITIHASQGETFTEKYTIHDWKFPRFCEKAKYVALSRGTNINNIQIA